MASELASRCRMETRRKWQGQKVQVGNRSGNRCNTKHEKGLKRRGQRRGEERRAGWKGKGERGQMVKIGNTEQP